jgi:hypothetical protein
MRRSVQHFVIWGLGSLGVDKDWRVVVQESCNCSCTPLALADTVVVVPEDNAALACMVGPVDMVAVEHRGPAACMVEQMAAVAFEHSQQPMHQRLRS